MIVSVVNEVLDRIKTDNPTLNVLPAFPDTIPNFPCAVVEEGNIQAHEESIDSSGETHNNGSINIEIFTKGYLKMTNAKKISIGIDGLMSGEYGMKRTIGQPIPNFADSEIYRYKLTYSYVINKSKTIYRR